MIKFFHILSTILVVTPSRNAVHLQGQALAFACLVKFNPEKKVTKNKLVCLTSSIVNTLDDGPQRDLLNMTFRVFTDKGLP